MDSTALDHLISRNRVPGAGYAATRQGHLDVVTCGMTATAGGSRVDQRTVFQAASLSKPVFAFLVLQLVRRGAFGLDDPLSEFLPDYFPDDTAARCITARHVLSHTTGLPNWRSGSVPLRAYFRPGSRFSYSGEGFVYLQAAVERTTGRSLEQLARELVFDPLDMRSSSYDRSTLDGARIAAPHDRHGSAFPTPLPASPNAAASLHTTCLDFAKFLRATLSGQVLDPEITRLWFEPASFPPKNLADSWNPQAEPNATYPGIGWGLGWGVQTADRVFFHWGDNPGYKAFACGSIHDQSAVVVFTNGDQGSVVAGAVVGALMPRARPSLEFLGWNNDLGLYRP